MKKGTRVDQKSFSTAGPRPQQRRSRSTIRWVLVSAVCIATFIGVLGIASAAQNSGGPFTLAQKMQGFQQLIKNARVHPRPKPSNQNQAPPVQPAPTRQAGILPLGQGPFPQSNFTVHNFWQGPVGSDWVLAYAGAKTNPDGTPGVGGIVLYTETINNQGGFDLHLLGTFLAPKGTTALVITAQQGNLLLLRSVTGQQPAFNLISHQFQ
jgi:hypothetical protein